VPWAASDGYYEEVREGQLIPEGSRAQPGKHVGVGPGLCRVWASENVPYGSWMNRGPGASQMKWGVRIWRWICLEAAPGPL
jgi:hypothetical protein